MLRQILHLFITAGFWSATLRIGTTYALGTLAELLSERAGVMNLGIEGIMLLGAMSGFLAVFLGAPLVVGVLAGLVTGLLAGYLFSLFVVKLALNQHVCGLALTLLCTGLALFIFRIATIHTDFNHPPSITPFKPIALPLLSGIPYVGQVLFNQTPLSYFAWLLLPLVAYFLYRTPMGLAVRTVGENPHCAESAGLDVLRIRTRTILVSSAIMGVAGAYLSISYFNAFLPGMVSGRGWICVALVVFSNWKPGKAFLAAFLFAGIEALAVRVQILGLHAPQQVFLMAPYIMTIVALVAVARRVSYPRALTMPFRKGERA